MSSSSSESDHEEEEEHTIASDAVVNKYKVAAEIVNKTLQALIGKAQAGVGVLELCEFGDTMLAEETAKVFKKEKELLKGIAFPTCVSVNNIICHYSPLKSESDSVIKEGDMVKFDLGAHIDGYAAVVGHTMVVGCNKDRKVKGKQADVILAAHTAADVALRVIKPGNKNTEVSETLSLAVEDYGCKLVESMASYQMKKDVYDAEKSFVLNPGEDCKKQEKAEFEVHEVWTVDIFVSTGDGKSKDSEHRTTVYKKRPTIYQLKMKASRQFYTELTKKFAGFPFSLRAFSDEKKAKMGVLECAKHDLVQPLSILTEKEGEFVAQFKFTLLLLPNGPLKITGLTFDPSLYESEHKVKNEQIKTLLSTAVRKTGKAKKKKNPAIPNIGDSPAQ